MDRLKLISARLNVGADVHLLATEDNPGYLALVQPDSTPDGRLSVLHISRGYLIALRDILGSVLERCSADKEPEEGIYESNSSCQVSLTSNGFIVKLKLVREHFRIDFSQYNAQNGDPKITTWEQTHKALTLLHDVVNASSKHARGKGEFKAVEKLFDEQNNWITPLSVSRTLQYETKFFAKKGYGEDSCEYLTMVQYGYISGPGNRVATLEIATIWDNYHIYDSGDCTILFSLVNNLRTLVEDKRVSHHEFHKVDDITVTASTIFGHLCERDKEFQVTLMQSSFIARNCVSIQGDEAMMREIAGAIHSLY